MSPAERLTTRAQREAMRSVKRVCYAGLDSVRLRQEVRQRTAEVLPSEAFALVTIDPDTGLFSHACVDIPEDLGVTYMREVYPREASGFIDLARTGTIVSNENSNLFQHVLRRSGLEHGLHAILCSDGEIWGSWCLFREPTSRSFRAEDADFLRAISPHIGYGLRSAALIEEAAASTGASVTCAPGVIVVDGKYRITLRSGPASAHLHDLRTVGAAADDLPYAVLSVLAELLRPTDCSGNTPGPEVRAQGRSGQWYLLRAALGEPDALGDVSAVIVLEPAAVRPGAVDLARRYRLTPREWDVLRLVLQGESTKRIGALLGISTHTVRDHLGKVYEKVGVRGRTALLAKLFQDRPAGMAGA
jgi:DNA-binding CsgD family transcriptional regulator